MTRSINILTPRRRWSTDEDAMIRELYPHTPTKDIAAAIGRTVGQVYQHAAFLGLAKTAEYLASPAACRLRREASPASIATRYQPGQVPHNKGLRRPGWGPGRMKETQFKPGVKQGVAAKLWKPVGSIRTDAEGFLRIKVREATKGEAHGFGNVKVWPLLNRHVWEQHKGPIPKSHAIVFKDGDRSNCDIANLECISRRELMQRNSSQRWGKEVFALIQLRGAVNRKIRSASEKQNLRSA